MPPGTPFVTIYISSAMWFNHYEEAQRYTQLEFNKAEDDFLGMVQKIEPKLERMRILTISGIPLLHVDIGLPKMIPLSYLGGGMRRIVYFMLSIFQASNGIVLINEIENGIHYSVLKNMWRIISDLSEKQNVQLFVTTHSAECINYLVEASKEKDIDFCIYRLDWVGEKIVAKRYEKDAVDVPLATD